MKEHLWTAASKETDVIKSAVKVYESLYKQCGVNPHFLHQGKNIFQKTICAKVQCSWSRRCELRNLHNLCKNKVFVRSADLKNCYIPWHIKFNNFQMKGKICFTGTWFGIADLFFWLEYHTVIFHYKNFDT